MGSAVALRSVTGVIVAVSVLCALSVVPGGDSRPNTDSDDGGSSSSPTEQNEQSNCVFEADNQPGRCIPLPRCAAAVQARREGRHPQLCGFPGSGSRVPDVCCPSADPWSAVVRARLPTRTTCTAFDSSPGAAAGDRGGPGSAARQVCREYQRQICNKEIETGRLDIAAGYGFSPADELEYPHMVLLGAGDRDDVEYFCGGSLISPNFVLTAAHCITIDGTPVRWVLLGALNRTMSLTRDAKTRQLLEVAEVIPHPEYTARARYHDIALIRLAQDARVAPNDVRPACLHTDVDDEVLGKMATVTGWGAEFFGEDGSESLLKGSVLVRRLDDCSSLASKVDSRLPRGLDESIHMCAGGDGSKATDACNGDSGGPLQLPALESAPDCMFRVAGVVSFGPPCGIGLPGVYTRVSTYVPWIEKIVWPRGQGECLADTGPGTVARRACSRYLREYCVGRGRRLDVPSLTRSTSCHYRRQELEASAQNPADSDRRYQSTDLDEFPHQVQLSHGEEPNSEMGCSGTLISLDFVLTAAHCTALDCLPVRSVTLGLISRTMLPPRVKEVAQVFVHPGYDPATRINDIALLRLREAIDKSSFQIRPACLHTDADDEPTGAIGTGFAANGRWEDTHGALIKASLLVTHASACVTSVGKDDSPSRPADPTQLCTGGGQNSSLFPGDSGGPLQTIHRLIVGLNWTFPDMHSNSEDFTRTVDEINVYQVAAVLSSPSPCGSGLPDVYTKVSPFVPWIESIVWPTAP